LYELAENIIASFDLSSEPDLFITHFLDAVLAYSTQEGNSPDEFLSWWEENKNKFSVTFPQGIDAVQIMTIHKAKGLEFPVVILPQANWGNDKINDLAWIPQKLEFAPMLETALISYQKNLLHTRLAKFYSLEVEKTFLDNLNLLYVATTRAKERLYIFCDKVDKPSGSAKNINDLISRYLNSLTSVKTGKNKYEFGDSDIYKLTQKEQPQSVYSLSIQKKVKSTNKITFKTASKKQFVVGEKEEINWGRILHAALARVYSFRDIPEASNYLLSVGEINNDERDRILHDLTDLLSRDEIRPFFEKGLRVKTEAEMADSKGNLLRADRLIFNNDTVIVMDYKTGRLHAQEHINQLSRYAECIAGMGYARVEKYLIYTAEKKLEKI
jgi:ATP-dependent exoDNAse (exonuclease V) beta subunit